MGAEVGKPVSHMAITSLAAVTPTIGNPLPYTPHCTILWYTYHPLTITPTIYTS
jgi:hypothetical protein